MKKAPYLLLLCCIISILISCEKEITGNFGNPNTKKEISIQPIMSEYDSLGKEHIADYELKIVEEKDTFWYRSYKRTDTISVTEVIINGETKKKYVTKDTIISYNDMTKKARFIRFDTIRLNYSDKYTEIRTLIETNAHWKASQITFSDLTSTSTQLLWAFPINQYGGGNSILRAKAMQGVLGVSFRRCVTQQLFFNDSTVLFQFNYLRYGKKTPKPIIGN